MGKRRDQSLNFAHGKKLEWIPFLNRLLDEPGTGTAVLMLQDEGKLNVAALVAKYLP